MSSKDVNSGLTFAVPGSANANATTFARFRFSTTGGLSPTGPAPDGEVEDYQLMTVPVSLLFLDNEAAELQSFTIE